jgi:hypothetical protein
MEGLVCRKADLNLVISRYLLNNLPEGKKLLLMNGFDPQEIKRAKEEAGTIPTAGITAPGPQDFLISYVGQITAGQDLETMLAILADFRELHSIRVRFIGSRLSPEQQRSIDDRLGAFLRQSDICRMERPWSKWPDQIFC